MFKLLSFLHLLTLALASNTAYSATAHTRDISIYLSVRSFVGATGHSFGAILTLNGSNDVISQPLVPFDSHINIAPHSNPKKTNFGGVNRRFQAKRTKY